ncbi:MAG: hypothetical protein ABFR75_03380 [Acidobacteriota bacterium]
MKLRKTVIFLLILLGSIYIFPEEKKPEILSVHFERSGDFIIYWKDVEVITEEYRIFADYLKYNITTKDVIAEGRVVMTSEDVSLTGDKLKFNIKEMKGEMYDVHGLMEPSVKFTVTKLEQVNREIQKFNKMTFTSCSQLVPRWEISSNKGKIRKDKYIEMRNAVLKIKKIPVFYFPYLRYPVKDGKSTGFLFPVLGKSEKLGYIAKNSFFLNIKPNLDLTLSIDYLSRIGVGGETEFRYMTKNSSGNIKFYMFKYSEDYKDSQEDDENISDQDFNLNLKHMQSFSFMNTKITADINYQSNPAFQEAFNKNYGRSYLSRFNSSFFVRSSVSNLKLSVMASRNETYYLEKNSSNVITKLPKFVVNLNQQKLGKFPGYFSLSSGFERINRSGVDYEEEIEFQSGVTSERFSFIPSYTLKLFNLPWLSTSVDLKSKHSYYLKSRDPETKEIVNEPLHLQYNSAKITFKGPSFYKIYENSKNKIKHLLEPEINVSYSTRVSDDERARLIPMDLFDYPSYSYVNFTLNSRIFLKSKNSNSSPREIFTYTIGQKYFFDPEEANRYRTISVDNQNIYPEFSELSNKFRLRPSRFFSTDISFVYNHYLKKFQRVSLNMNYLNPDSVLNGTLSYSLYLNPYRDEDFFLNREMIRGDLTMDIPSFPVKFHGTIDYDLTRNVFRYGNITASYNYQCINFNAEVRLITNFFTDEMYAETIFGITFGNLGLVKDFFSGNK